MIFELDDDSGKFKILFNLSRVEFVRIDKRDPDQHILIIGLSRGSHNITLRPTDAEKVYNEIIESMQNL